MADQTPTPQPTRHWIETVIDDGGIHQRLACADPKACTTTTPEDGRHPGYCNASEWVHSGDALFEEFCAWPAGRADVIGRVEVEVRFGREYPDLVPVGGQPQPDTPGDLPREARALVDRVERVLQEWSDASEPRRAEIWQAMHDQADVVRDVLDAPAPRPDTPTDPAACPVCGNVDCLHARDSRVNCPTKWGTPTDPDQPAGEALDGALAYLIDRTRNNIITEPPATTVREMLADLGWEMSLRPLAGVRGEPQPCAAGCVQQTCAPTAAYSGQCGSCCDCIGACEQAEKAKQSASGRGEPHTTPADGVPLWCDFHSTVEHYPAEDVERIIYALTGAAASKAIEPDGDRVHAGWDWRDVLLCHRDWLRLSQTQDGYAELADAWVEAREGGGRR